MNPISEVTMELGTRPFFCVELEDADAATFEVHSMGLTADQIYRLVGMLATPPIGWER